MNFYFVPLEAIQSLIYIHTKYDSFDTIPKKWKGWLHNVNVCRDLYRFRQRWITDINSQVSLLFCMLRSRLPERLFLGKVVSLFQSWKRERFKKFMDFVQLHFIFQNWKLGTQLFHLFPTLLFFQLVRASSSSCKASNSFLMLINIFIVIKINNFHYIIDINNNKR